MNSRTYTLVIGLVVVAAVIAAAWYFFFRDAAPELGGELPATVALINGEEVTRGQLEAAETEISAAQGINLATLDAETRTTLRRQILDTVISQELVAQAAAASGATVTSEAVDTELAAIRAQFESDEAYQAALDGEGLTEAELREQIEANLLTQTYLEAELQLASIAVTEEEIETTYQEVVAGAEDAPPLEEVRDQVEAFIRQQKQQEIVAQFVEQLRAEADVEILI